MFACCLRLGLNVVYMCACYFISLDYKSPALVAHSHPLTAQQIEARQRQAVLQERILEAEESARLAKLEAKRGTAMPAQHTAVSLNNDAAMRSSRGKLISEGVFSSLSKSELRSPSMLQLVSSSADVDCTGEKNNLSTQRGQSNNIKKVCRVERNNKTVLVASGQKGGENEVMKRRNSRIPVIQQSQGTNKSKVVAGSKIQQTSKIETDVRNNKAANQRTRETNGGSSVKAATAGRRPVIERSVSPPVPVVAKRLKEQGLASIADRRGVQMYTCSDHSPPDDSGTIIRNHSHPVLAEFSVESHMTVMPHQLDDRALSPPVPALAKKLRGEGWGQTHTTMATKTVVESSERALSPPVPSVAKRMKSQVTIQDHETCAQDIQNTRTENLHGHVSVRTSSPPVPALAKKLYQGKAEHKMGLIDEESKNESSAKLVVNKNSDSNVCVGEKFSSIDTDNIQLHINRPPSCKPDSKPLSPVTMTTSSLPVIATATSGDNLLAEPQSTNRQRLILQQLTMLKEGILTQQNSIDHRVKTILNRNKQCSF